MKCAKTRRLATIALRTIAGNITCLIVLASYAQAQSNVNPDHKWAWGENIGWLNWCHGAEDPNRISVGVCVGDTFVAGFIWAENVGWINVGNGDGPYANDLNDSSTFGVNLDPSSDPNSPELVGYAWAENVGWINFEGGRLPEPPEPARLENGCRLRGYAWGENIGWINLDDDEKFVMASRATSTGTPMSILSTLPNCSATMANVPT